MKNRDTIEMKLHWPMRSGEKIELTNEERGQYRKYFQLTNEEREADKTKLGLTNYRRNSKDIEKKQVFKMEKMEKKFKNIVTNEKWKDNEKKLLATEECVEDKMKLCWRYTVVRK